MATWYYSDGTTRHGPVEETEIQRLIGTGEIIPSTLVWKTGLDGWMTAASQFDVPGEAEMPPPLPETGAGAPPLPPSAPAASASVPPPPRYGADTGAGGHTTPDGLYVGAPARSFGEAISVCFSNYFTFSGRASRSEYWFFALFVFVIGFVAALIDALLFPNMPDVSPLNTLVTLGTFFPSLAVAFRRLHDTDRSGWWIGGFYLGLIVLVLLIVGAVASASPGSEPEGVLIVIGALVIAAVAYGIMLIVFLATKGNPGPNRFG
ncbi:DUF805 domain-containing protein [Rhodobacterales bacterium HKCCE2091]|nr:DUF805 domain-containing protein [Rhodobacterales bacterium HKCCE2091]